MTAGPGCPWFPSLDHRRCSSLVSRSREGWEEVPRVHPKLPGLEGGSHERAVDLMAQVAQGAGIYATSLFEGALRFGPTPAARAAAAFFADIGDREPALNLLEPLLPPERRRATRTYLTLQEPDR